MSPVIVRFTSQFKHRFKKYNQIQQVDIWGKIECFKNNPYDASLKTHKLSGQLNNKWSFSVNYSTRIIFVFISNNLVDFVDIGGHEIYK